jgi:FtsH-binding integral membrane protein
MMSNSDYDFHDNAFSEKAIRQGFIRKVYSILSVQFIMTIGVALLFANV